MINQSSLVAALSIAHNDLACYTKNRIAIFWTFLGPALCMWLFGFLTPSAATLSPVFLVHKEANPQLAATLIKALRQNGHPVTEVDKSPTTGFAVEVQSPGAVSPVLLHTNPDEDEAERSLRFEIDAELWSLKASQSLERGKPGLTVGPISMPLGTNGFQRTVPAYLIMFLTMNLLVSGSSFAEERVSGRMRRLLVAPIPALSIIVGRLASRLVIGWVQMLVLFSIGVFLLRIQWTRHTVSLILILSLYILAMGSIGIVIGTFFKDPDQASAFAMWSALILAPLSGLWWPIDLMPAAFQTIAHLLPTDWVMQTVNCMLVSGANIGNFQRVSFGFIAIAAIAIGMSARGLKTLR